MTIEEAREILTKERKSMCCNRCDYNCRLYEIRDRWCDMEMALDMAILALETHPCLSAIIAEREEEKKPKIWCANCKHCEIRYTEERVGHDRGYQPLAKVAYRHCLIGLSCSDARMYCEKYDEKEEKVI